MRTRRLVTAAILLLPAAATLPVPSGATPGDMLELGGSDRVQGSVNGVAARVLVTSGGPSVPVLDPALAVRAGLKSGWIAAQGRIGPVVMKGSSTVVALDLGTGVRKRRILWFDRGYAAAADVAVGPGGMPQPVVRFVLGPPHAEERTVTLPLADFGLSGVGTLLRVGEATVRVSFAVDRMETMASAAAASLIAAANGGRLAGAAMQQEVRFGVARPVRRMTLAAPLAIGPLTLGAMLVRTADYGTVGAIPDADADPDEIVVNAKRRGSQPQPRLIVGRAALAGCSSIGFDKPAQRIVLRCVG